MCRDARLRRKLWYTESCSCSGKSAAPERSSADMADALEHLADHVQAGMAPIKSQIAFGELTVTVAREEIVRSLTFLRDDGECQFKVLEGICGVDQVNRERRFDVVYHLLSVAKNQRIRIKVETGESEPVPSVISVYPAANWFEREAFD